MSIEMRVCVGFLRAVIDDDGFVLARSVDPFTKKDWYDIKAPSMFSVRNIGKTLVTRTQGTKVRRCAIAG